MLYVVSTWGGDGVRPFILLSASVSTRQQFSWASPFASDDERDVLLMVDDRELLGGDLDFAPTPSLAAVINADYARHHNMRFIYAIPIPPDNASAIRAAATLAAHTCNFSTPQELLLLTLDDAAGGAAADVVEGTSDTARRDRLTGVHFGWGLRRASCWLKLLPVWALLRSEDAHPVNVFLLDADAVFANADASPADKLLNSTTMLQRRAGANLSSVLVAFLSNEPYPSLEEHYPQRGKQINSGIFFAYGRERQQEARTFMRQWWDFTGWWGVASHEQAALQSALYNLPNCAPPLCTFACEGWGMHEQYALMAEDPFMLDRADPWILHVGSEFRVRQRSMFSAILKERGYTNELFEIAVAAIKPLRFNMLDTALAIHIESCVARKSCAGTEFPSAF